MTYIGLDMSLSSSGVCIIEGNKHTFYFFPQRKREIDFNKKISNDTGIYNFKALKEIPTFESREERYDFITSEIMNILMKYKDATISIEGYALSAQGQGVSMLFELGGIIRHKLYKNGFKFKEYSPTTIKKYATSNGHSNKNVMGWYFKELTKVDLYEILGIKESKTDKIPKPIEDIQDALFIAKIQSNSDYKPEENLVIDNLMEMF